MIMIGQPVAFMRLGYIALQLVVKFGKRFTVTGFDKKAY